MMVESGVAIWGGESRSYGFAVYIEQVEKMVDALCDALYHEIARGFYRVSHQIETLDSSISGYVCALGDAVHRPFAAIGAYSEDAAALVKCVSEHHTQIGEGQSFFIFDIVALDDLVADE